MSTPWLVLTVVASIGCGSSGTPCPAGTYDCLGVCRALGTACGDADAATEVDAAMDTDAATEPDSSVEPDSGATDPCTIDGRLVDSRCVDGGAYVRCETGETVDCDSPYPVCAEWQNEEGAVEAGCFARDLRPCDADEPEDVGLCDGTEAHFRCQDNLNAHWSNQPARVRSVRDCTDSWPDGSCSLDMGTPHCSSPSAPACDPETFEAGCSPDGRGRTSCDSSARQEYVEPCEESETCRLCPDELTPSRCIPNSATPSTHTVEGPQFYDLLSCVDARRVRVAQCMWEWTARCPAEEPVCHDRLDGGAECRSESARFCTTPGSTECSADREVAYECSDSGNLVSKWCAGEYNLCDPATGDCYDTPIFSPCSGDPTHEACTDADVYEHCIENPFNPGEIILERVLCAGGCTTDSEGGVECRS